MDGVVRAWIIRSAQDTACLVETHFRVATLVRLLIARLLVIAWGWDCCEMMLG